MKLKIAGKSIKQKDIPPELQARIEHALKKKPATCPYCSRHDIIRNGVWHTQNGDVQLFHCNDCDRRFTPYRAIFQKRTPYILAIVKQLHTSGESLRNIATVLRGIGTNVSHVTIFNWLNQEENNVQTKETNI